MQLTTTFFRRQLTVSSRESGSHAGQRRVDQGGGLELHRLPEATAACSAGVVWSYRQAPDTRRAAAFWSQWRNDEVAAASSDGDPMAQGPLGLCLVGHQSIRYAVEK